MNTEQNIAQKSLQERVIALNYFHMKDKIDLLNAMKERFGEEVLVIVETVEGNKAFKEWQEIAKQNATAEIKDLIQLLWEPLRLKGFEFTYEEKEDGIQMHCTKCPIFEMAKVLGGTEWMYYHTCKADEYITEGFNPKIGFERTKTLMQGDSCCDHFYYYKELNDK